MKKDISTNKLFRFLKIVLVTEAIYWFTFLTSGIWGIQPLLSGEPIQLIASSFIIHTGIPCLVESIALPIALFKLAIELKPSKPAKGAIKWGLIAGTIYIFVWWLNNAGVWIYTIIVSGIEYLTLYPVNIFSFVFTVFGLLALGIFSIYFAKKSIGTETLNKLKLRTVGLIIFVAGFYFLWNYLAWLIFGKPEMWSNWYAWFMGHNLDLWVLSLPMIGIPLLLKKFS